MAIVPLAEIKAVVFAYCGDYQSIEAMVEAISNITPEVEQKG